MHTRHYTQTLKLELTRMKRSRVISNEFISKCYIDIYSLNTSHSMWRFSKSWDFFFFFAILRFLGGTFFEHCQIIESLLFTFSCLVTNKISWIQSNLQMQGCSCVWTWRGWNCICDFIQSLVTNTALFQILAKSKANVPMLQISKLVMALPSAN